MQITIPKPKMPKLPTSLPKYRKIYAQVLALIALGLLALWTQYSFLDGSTNLKVTGELYAKTYNSAYKGGSMTYTSHYVMYVGDKQIVKSVNMLQSDWDKSEKGNKRDFTIKKRDLYSDFKEAWTTCIGFLMTVITILVGAFFVFKYLMTDENGKWPKWMD